MQNVISFPKPITATPARRTSGAKTLFLHIKNATLIVHLAANPMPALPGGKLGRQS